MSAAEIANCFDYRCPKVWNRLKKTDREGVRFCKECERDVFFTENREEAQQLAKDGKCVAFRVSDEEIGHVVGMMRDYPFDDMKESIWKKVPKRWQKIFAEKYGKALVESDFRMADRYLYEIVSPKVNITIKHDDGSVFRFKYVLFAEDPNKDEVAIFSPSQGLQAFDTSSNEYEVTKFY